MAQGVEDLEASIPRPVHSRKTCTPGDTMHLRRRTAVSRAMSPWPESGDVLSIAWEASFERFDASQGLVERGADTPSLGRNRV